MSTRTDASPRIVVGISGWDYPSWRGSFYPTEVTREAWLTHAAHHVGLIEVNATFRNIMRPEHFRRWAGSVDDDFVFAIKGNRYITHDRLLDVSDSGLANFFASGILELGTATGPFLWQLPPHLRFDRDLVERFLDALPRSSSSAATLAKQHGSWLDGRATVDTDIDVPFRHALEPRHRSFFTDEARAVLGKHDIALVVGDADGRFATTSTGGRGFAYLRLHGSTRMYASRYSDDELEAWAGHAVDAAAEGNDVYVAFNNTMVGHAPVDAWRFEAAVRRRGGLLTSSRMAVIPFAS